MRNLHDPEVDQFRCRDAELIRRYGFAGDETCGMFLMGMSKTSNATLRVIAASGEGWDHVSVSLPHRTPTWAEMEAVKRLFFNPDETAMQLHVPPAEHINRHEFVLHLWRPHDREIPRPPAIMV
jgi:hypothetical protein